MQQVSAVTLLQQLKAFDEGLAPAGMYASDRGLLFTKVIYPFFKAAGFRVGTYGKTGLHAYFEIPGEQNTRRLDFVSISKVKVRAFGNRYRIDDHVDHGEGWNAKAMEKLVSALPGPNQASQPNWVMFVGYAAEQAPFELEIESLRESVKWDARGTCFDSLSWRDPHGRDFSTRVCLWSSPHQTG